MAITVCARSPVYKGARYRTSSGSAGSLVLIRVAVEQRVGRAADGLAGEAAPGEEAAQPPPRDEGVEPRVGLRLPLASLQCRLVLVDAGRVDGLADHLGVDALVAQLLGEQSGAAGPVFGAVLDPAPGELLVIEVAPAGQFLQGEVGRPGR